MDSRCNFNLIIQVERDRDMVMVMDMRLLDNAMLDLPKIGKLRLKQEDVATVGRMVGYFILLPADIQITRYPVGGNACCRSWIHTFRMIFITSVGSRSDCTLGFGK